MALNINIQGNVYDSSENLIDCYYQAYSQKISKWSNVRQTQYGQYNVNFGDGDLNTQSGKVSNGDILIILFWTGSDNKNDRLEKFSAFLFVYTGDDINVIDVQIIEPVAPSCSFILDQERLIDEEVHARSVASTTYQWDFKGQTFYHRRRWYGEDIFGFMDIISDQFDFGDGYSGSSTYVYNNVGTFSVSHRVISSYKKSSECNKDIKIKYPKPSTTISFSSDNPILGDEVTISNVTYSDYDVIKRITYSYEDVNVDGNNSNPYNYNVTLDIFKEYTFYVHVVWNDGFSDRMYTVKKILHMKNQPPTVDILLKESDTVGGYFNIDISAKDVDGTIEHVCWKLFYKMPTTGLPYPYFKCHDLSAQENFYEIYKSCDSELKFNLYFAIPGEYKIKAIATDNLGGIGKKSVEFNVTDVCDGILGECPECPECPDTYDCYDEIRKAVDECMSSFDSAKTETGERVIIVSEGKTANGASGEIGGKIIAEIKKEDLISSISNKLSGKIQGSKVTGKISGGSISGKVKK